MNYEELNALLTQADELNNRGNYKQAETLTTTALKEFEKTSGSSEAQSVTERKMLHCSALISLATTNYRRSDFDAALSLARAALDIAEEYALSESKANAWNMKGKVYYSLSSYDKALECFEQAHAVRKELGDKSGEARVIGNIGNVHLDLGSYDKALEYYEQSLAGLKELGEKSLVALSTGNIGSLYFEIGSYDKALEYYDQALSAYEELGEKSGVVLVTGNIGNVYHNLGSYDKALEYYEQALAGHKELGEKSEVVNVIGNIGNVYSRLGSYDKALEYFEQALAVHKELGAKSGVVTVTWFIGCLYANKKYHGFDAAIAEEFLNNAIVLANEIQAKALLVNFHKSLAALYKKEERWKEFALTFEKYIELKDEVNIEETKKQDAIREQQKAIELAKAKADAKHQATEQLLHNVLPPSIANKMLDGTKLIAEKIPSVSVLFADIVNFTKLSQRITPEELVEGLDRIFSTFDALAEKHGLEKIKTIGDAYMVVSGAPIQREDHAEAMANFALEMVEAMKEFRSISTGEEIQLRIGIHSGEVVAGVIGKKKFAYDLWGDAVNTASRMESHGEAGKIHVSEEFKHAVETQNFASLQFIERGEMAIKGKGMMKTYFLEQAR